MITAIKSKETRYKNHALVLPIYKDLTSYTVSYYHIAIAGTMENLIPTLASISHLGIANFIFLPSYIAK